MFLPARCDRMGSGTSKSQKNTQPDEPLFRTVMPPFVRPSDHDIVSEFSQEHSPVQTPISTARKVKKEVITDVSVAVAPGAVEESMQCMPH